MAKSLLLVDDSATMRKIILRTLRMAGLDIDSYEEAGDGNEALEKLKEKTVDISFVISTCPEWAAWKWLRKSEKWMLVLILRSL